MRLLPCRDTFPSFTIPDIKLQQSGYQATTGPCGGAILVAERRVDLPPDWSLVAEWRGELACDWSLVAVWREDLPVIGSRLPIGACLSGQGDEH